MTLAKHEQVNAAVQEKHKKTEEDLNLSGQPCRIKKRQDVVLNETGLIPPSSSRFPEPMLQWRERADPAGEFNQGSPTCRRKVEPYHPPPFQNQESSEQDKKNEGEVEKNEEISQPVIEKRRGYHSEQKTRFRTKTSRPERNYCNSIAPPCRSTSASFSSILFPTCQCSAVTSDTVPPGK